MRIRARIYFMAASEIQGYIKPEIYERIRAEDQHPLFRAYAIGHEGVAEGTMLGVGKIVYEWMASAIKKLYDKLQLGTPIFHNHEPDTNDHAGRTVIGEIVGKAIKDMGRRLTAVAIAYIRPAFRHLPLDIASVEADISVLKQGGKMTDMDVGEVSAVALGNSMVNQPGFPGATLLAQVQAFARREARFGKGGEMETEEIKEFIKERKLKPSDIFGIDALAEDDVVVGILESEKKRATSGEYAHRKRDEEKAAKEKKDLEDKLAEAEKKLKTKDLEIAKAKVGPLLEKAAEARKFDERQRKFVSSRIERFAPKSAETIEADLAAHLDAEVDELKKVTELLGLEGGDDKRKGGGEPGTGDKGRPEDKYLDPDQNPMIPRAGMK